MNRRNFLKSLGAVVSAAVVAPVTLLAAKPDPWTKATALRKKNAAAMWMEGKDGSRIEGYYNFNPFSEADRKAYRKRIHKLWDGEYYDETIQTTE